MIHIKVDNHALTAVSDEPLVAKTIGVAVFEAEFSPDWEDYEKRVVFSGPGGTKPVLYTGGVMLVPWEPMDIPGRLWISAVGLAEGKRDVTAMMASCLYVTENGDLGEDATESDPTLPPTEQAVLACAKSAREARAAAARAEAAAANPPKISGDGTWLVWDAESGAYVDTGIPVPTGGSTPGGGGIDVSGAEVGQTIKIAAVDENGVPTAWEPVEFPSGGSDGLLAKYVHEGNKEVYPSSFDIETGVYSCEAPHGINERTVVCPVVHNDGVLASIPKELCTKGLIFLEPLTEKTFNIVGDAVPLSYTTDNNESIDVTKFHFDCFVAVDLKIDLARPAKAMNVYISGVTGTGDMYLCAYYPELVVKPGFGSFGGMWPALSNRAHHCVPKYFFCYLTIMLNSVFITYDGYAHNRGFKPGRVYYDGDCAIRTTGIFGKDTIDCIRVCGPSKQKWYMTNGFTIIVKEAGV